MARTFCVAQRRWTNQVDAECTAVCLCFFCCCVDATCVADTDKRVRFVPRFEDGKEKARTHTRTGLVETGAAHIRFGLCSLRPVVNEGRETLSFLTCVLGHVFCASGVCARPF